uniref:(northern house mosquito) hypothetical protein n=1 Tax=Culex pipiens TaxID=7175 RepID=A0A8D8BJS2_CULPI
MLYFPKGLFRQIFTRRLTLIEGKSFDNLFVLAFSYTCNLRHRYSVSSACGMHSLVPNILKGRPTGVTSSSKLGMPRRGACLAMKTSRLRVVVLHGYGAGEVIIRRNQMPHRTYTYAYGLWS